MNRGRPHLKKFSPSRSETLVELPPIARTAEGMRDAIFDEIDSLRAGKVTVSHARALSHLVGRIIEAARLEFLHRKLINDQRATLRLGNRPHA